MVRRWLVLVGWLAFVGGSIAGLHHLGHSFPPELAFDPGGPIEPALAAVLRLAGLVVGYWSAVSTILYLIGKAGRVPGTIRAVGWATIGPVRRLIDGVVAGALVVGFGLPATAIATTGPGYLPVPAGDPLETGAAVRGSLTPGPSFLPIDQIPVPGIGDPGSKAPLVANGPTEVVVKSGDHLWSLAEQRLTQVRGEGVSDAEIALYWLKMIDINLARIRSGDPDLIVPGEILLLPGTES